MCLMLFVRFYDNGYFYADFAFWVIFKHINPDVVLAFRREYKGGLILCLDFNIFTTLMTF